MVDDEVGFRSPGRKARDKEPLLNVEGEKERTSCWKRENERNSDQKAGERGKSDIDREGTEKGSEWEARYAVRDKGPRNQHVPNFIGSFLSLGTCH